MKQARSKILIPAILAVIGLILGVCLRPGQGNRSTPTLSIPEQAPGERHERPNIMARESAEAAHEVDIASAGNVATGELAKGGRYESLGAALSAARHAVEPIEPDDPHGRGADFFASNPGQQLRAWFSKDGVELASGIPTPEGEEEWNVALRAERIGRGGSWRTIRATSSSSHGDRMEASDPASGVTQWFVNHAKGIEQGFTLRQKPEGESGEVVVRMAVQGTLRAEAFAEVEGEGVRFVDGQGRETVHYTGLRAWDADGRDLAARMEVRSGILELAVNDQGAVYPVTIDPLFANVEARLEQVSIGIDRFGSSVALGENTALVGAPFGGTASGTRVGFVYVFVREGSAWRMQAKLSASDARDQDRFGFSVAIDGHTAIIGSGSGLETEHNRAIVFARTGEQWVQQAEFSNDDRANNFATSVALSGDTALVNGNNKGAYVYVRNGDIWSKQANLGEGTIGFMRVLAVAIDGDTALFGGEDDPSARVYVRGAGGWVEQAALPANGRALALNGDTALVGSGLNARSFTRSGIQWTEQGLLTPSDGTGISSISLHGDTAVLGKEGESPAYYVFTRSGGAWSEQEKLTSGEVAAGNFSFVAVAVRGESVLVGQVNFQRAGGAYVPDAAYVFVRSGASWSKQETFISPPVRAEDLFGFPVAVSGGTALVGAPGDDNLSRNDAGSVYSFVRNGSTWEEGDKLIPSDPESGASFGQSVDLDGDTAVVGSNHSSENRAYVFRRIGAGWNEESRLGFPQGGEGFIGFGESVAIDGDTAVIGAPYSQAGGNAYVYARTGTAWSMQAELTAVDTPSVSEQQFGASVDVSGQRCIVGSAAASADQEFRGAVRVYHKNGATWNEEAIITVPQGPGANFIGNSASLSGDTALLAGVTRPLDEDGFVSSDAIEGGCAYVFVRSGAAWSQQARLVATDGAPIGVHPEDFFQSTSPIVALDGNTALVGAPRENGNSGSARVFTRNGILWSEQLKLTAGVDTSIDKSFGACVALDGNVAVVGTFTALGGDIASPGKAYTFLIGESPQITGQPLSRTVPLTDPGTPVSFTATATGYGPLQYQWRKNGDNIEGAAGELVGGTTTFSIAEVAEDDAGLYDVVISNAGGIATSSPATLSVNALSEFGQLFPDPAPDAQGFVLVTLSPAGIGGWRFQGEQAWRASGVPVGGLATGDRVIEFRPTPGYLHPPPETVGVVSGGAAAFVERFYFETPATGTGALAVTLMPEAIAAASVPIQERAQWRFLGEDDSQWRDSGATRTGLIPGNYLIECKPVPGRTTPPPAGIVVASSATSAPTVTYFLADPVTGDPPALVAFEAVSADTAGPYAHVGQIRSDAGASSGFVVKKRVVATAAHVVFDDGTLSAATGLQWLFQRHSGTYEPKPQIPRGFYIYEGYEDRRRAENTPGSSTPESQNLDAAAMYFLEDAGRGGFAGYLASDSPNNEFLLSGANKTLVGYPVSGVPSSNQGKMHATPAKNVAFVRAFGSTFTTSDIRSGGGGSGGPLCVQFEGGAFYPAAIYLGGTGQTVVRAIDSEVITLFDRAEVSGNGGDNNTDGGVTHTSVSGNLSVTLAGSLRVNIEPAGALAMGAAWQLNPEATLRASGSQKSGLSPGTYSLTFKTIEGFHPPTIQPIAVTGGQLTTITYTYLESNGATPLETWRQTHFGTTANTGDAADDNDFDKDGTTNLDEFIAGTNPKNGNDVFKMATTAKSGNTFTTTCAGKAGRTYTLLRNTGLSGTWTRLEDPQGPLMSDGTVTLSDTDAPPDKCFYRIEVSMP